MGKVGFYTMNDKLNREKVKFRIALITQSQHMYDDMIQTLKQYVNYTNTSILVITLSVIKLTMGKPFQECPSFAYVVRSLTRFSRW